MEACGNPRGLSVDAFCGVIVKIVTFFIMYAGRYVLERGPRWKVRGQAILKRPEAHPYVLSSADEERIIRLCHDYGLEPKEGGKWRAEITTKTEVTDRSETFTIGRYGNGYNCCFVVSASSSENPFTVRFGALSHTGVFAVVGESSGREGISCYMVDARADTLRKWSFSYSLEGSLEFSVTGSYVYSFVHAFYTEG